MTRQKRAKRFFKRSDFYKNDDYEDQFEEKTHIQKDCIKIGSKPLGRLPGDLGPSLLRVARLNRKEALESERALSV